MRTGILLNWFSNVFIKANNIAGVFDILKTVVKLWFIVSFLEST